MAASNRPLRWPTEFYESFLNECLDMGRQQKAVNVVFWVVAAQNLGSRHCRSAPKGATTQQRLATVSSALSSVAGAVLARLRTASVWIGLGLGIVAIIVLGWRLAPAAAPTALQIRSLVAAIVVEFVAFPMVMPRVRPRGGRAVAVATLAIVGAHFVNMVPALGSLAGVLGLACVANPTGLARVAGYGVRAAWAADGVLKVALGAAMVAAAGGAITFGDQVRLVSKKQAVWQIERAGDHQSWINASHSASALAP